MAVLRASGTHSMDSAWNEPDGTASIEPRCSTYSKETHYSNETIKGSTSKISDRDTIRELLMSETEAVSESGPGARPCGKSDRSDDLGSVCEERVGVEERMTGSGLDVDT